jgi:hypothetical protein
MFYKIDPKREQMVFDLAAEGFLTGDRVWVDLRGDFQPTPSGSTATDTFSNTSFELGGAGFGANLPTVVQARGTTLLALNHDEPIGDNSDPDDDYGVLVRLAAFSAGDDVFRFGARTELPEVQGSIYRAGAGDDFVTMPNAPVAGFNHRRVFQAGAGDDTVRAGTLDVRVNFGAGEDRFLERGARVAWADPENRDNDSRLVVTTTNGERHQVTNAEVLVDGRLENPLVKWYFDIDPAEDGRFTIGFYENGRLVRQGGGFYDEALPVLEGDYQASFRTSSALGETIRLDGVGGRPDVLLHRGGEGGAEADLVTSRAFLKAVFRHLDAAYDELGRELPWRKGFAPLVPVTVAVGDTDQPFLRARDLAAEDRRASVVAPRFRLENDGDAPGLEAKSVQVFFKVEGTATQGVDWDFEGGTRRFNGRNDFADAVLRHGRDGDGDMVYSVMIEAGERAADVPIEIFRDRVAEGRETVLIEIVDLDLWGRRASGDVLDRLSGGPGADRESDLDGPVGREADLLRDRELVVAIHDDLIA